MKMNNIPMADSSKENIRIILNSVREMLESDRIISSELRKLSNEILEDVSLFQDQETISVTVLVYSLYKVFNKRRDLEKESLLKLLNKSISCIDNNQQFRTALRHIFDQIKKYDKNIDMNILQILKHSQVKRGLKVYEHGLSIGQAAEIIGVSKWQIMDYLGSSNIIDKDANSRIECRERLAFARGLFK
jgi:hypothetical protein